MANDTKSTKSTRTAVIGIAFILVGTLLLGVQMSSAFAGHLEQPAYEKQHQIGCGEDVIPFDSFQKYMPHVVRFAYPLGNEMAAYKIEFDGVTETVTEVVATAVAEIRTALSSDKPEAIQDAHSHPMKRHTAASASTI